MRPIDIMRLGAGHGGGMPGTLVSLLHFDGADGSTTITDETGKVWTANGSAQLDTAQAKFGPSSLLMPDGSASITRALTGADAFGTGDFTIEMFRRFDSGARQYLYSQNNNDAAIIFTPSSGALEVYGPSSYVIASGSTPQSTGVWYHLALTRAANVWRFFIGGALYESITDARSWGQSSGTLTIAGAFGANVATGHFDEFRVIQGHAVYTANFTPPSAPF